MNFKTVAAVVMAMSIPSSIMAKAEGYNKTQICALTAVGTGVAACSSAAVLYIKQCREAGVTPTVRGYATFVRNVISSIKNFKQGQNPETRAFALEYPKLAALFGAAGVLGGAAATGALVNHFSGGKAPVTDLDDIGNLFQVNINAVPAVDQAADQNVNNADVHPNVDGQSERGSSSEDAQDGNLGDDAEIESTQSQVSHQSADTPENGVDHNSGNNGAASATQPTHVSPLNASTTITFENLEKLDDGRVRMDQIERSASRDRSPQLWVSDYLTIQKSPVVCATTGNAASGDNAQAKQQSQASTGGVLSSIAWFLKAALIGSGPELLGDEE